MTLGGDAISWKSKQQNDVTTSTTEVEYVVLAMMTRNLEVP